jgi:alpha-tubulin suppressor-like RCC1 family protein
MPSQSQEPLKAAIADVVSVAAGDHFSVAVKSDGSVWAWGSNSSEQIGDDADVDWQTTPVQVPGVENAVDVAAAGSTAVALLADGTLVAWGSNTNGALGRGSFMPVEDGTPAAVTGVGGVQAVSIGGALAQVHGLALLDDGTLMTWGGNSLAALGQPTSTPANPTPASVPGVSDVVAIAAGQSFSLVVTDAGEVYGWGGANVGQLGAGTVGAFSQAPVKADVVSVAAVAAGQQHVVALHLDGTISTWGSNSFGQLGIGADSGFRLAPQALSGEGFTFVAAGVQFSFGLDGVGTAWGWGNNLNLQLGLAADRDTTRPAALW